jgi:hypothetical protein
MFILSGKTGCFVSVIFHSTLSSSLSSKHATSPLRNHSR